MEPVRPPCHYFRPDFAFGIINGAYIVGSGGVNVDASGGTVTADEQLVVVRIEYGDAGNGSIVPEDDEVVALWVDPVNELSTSVIDGVSTNFLSRGGGKIENVSIRGDQMFGSPAFFDNLRVGSSFTAVVPEPSTLSLLAMGLIALIPLRRRFR